MCKKKNTYFCCTHLLARKKQNHYQTVFYYVHGTYSTESYTTKINVEPSDFFLSSLTWRLGPRRCWSKRPSDRRGWRRGRLRNRGGRVGVRGRRSLHLVRRLGCISYWHGGVCRGIGLFFRRFRSRLYWDGGGCRCVCLLLFVFRFLCRSRCLLGDREDVWIASLVGVVGCKKHIYVLSGCASSLRYARACPLLLLLSSWAGWTDTSDQVRVHVCTYVA